MYSPEGKRKGRLTLGETNASATASNPQTEAGKLMQELEKPAKGMWIIKIVPTKCTASIRVSALQISNP